MVALDHDLGYVIVKSWFLFVAGDVSCLHYLNLCQITYFCYDG